ncbi:uncharacterized protein LOC128837218 [Malaclemys terrapin pileata]|uniref:uncharacterized protein LOC128837218 n=1 Tax=Malaclemys terrapin pileata TaxID=2991368 RepID=UPI0023A7DC8F|nr:uncharacterized protein LOC128837218 [Malaclemys terrapin pileata]
MRFLGRAALLGPPKYDTLPRHETIKYSGIIALHSRAAYGPGLWRLSRSILSLSLSEILIRVMSPMVTCFELATSATVSQPSLASHSQRLAKIRHRKKRTREDMFSELMACSQAQAAQQTQWREKLTQMQQANMDREERWRQEDQQATQTLLGLLREQTDTLRRLVDVLQERRQEDRAPLQSISNRPPPPPSPIPTSPKVQRRRGSRVPANSHSTPAESSSSRRLSFPKT